MGHAHGLLFAGIALKYGMSPNEVRNVTRDFHVGVEKDADGWYVASVPALRGCHTQAKSLDALMRRIREAIELCLQVEEPVGNEFVGVQRVMVKTGAPSPPSADRN